jgi:two-component system alkaline phosphatase synthesis response regulator PhoP
VDEHELVREDPVLDKDRVGRLGLTALVVDDNRSVVRVVASLLESHGFHVYTAFDGAEGLEKARRERPDVIVLDVLMPELDGYEVARLLQDEPETAGIPILMLTVTGRVDDPDLDEAEVAERIRERMKGFDAGALDFVTKPIKARALLRRIEGLLWWDLPVGADQQERPERPRTSPPGNDGHVVGKNELDGKDDRDG